MPKVSAFARRTLAIEAAIAAGNRRWIAKEIDTLARGLEAGAPQRLVLAKLARRAELPDAVLRLLHRTVRGSGHVPATPSSEEASEYGLALLRVGAVHDGQHLLARHADGSYPRAYLYQALGRFQRWDYRSAIPILETFLKATADERDRLIGWINLSEALVHEQRFTEAEPILEAIEKESRSPERRNFLRHVYERRAEIAIYRKRWEESEELLSSAEREPGASPFDQLFIAKWKAIARLLRNPRRGEAPLAAVRERAVRLEDWETVRECDFHRAVGLRDETVFLKVYFGTPFESYRARLQDHFGTPVKIPDEFELRLGVNKPSRSLDFLLAETAGTAGALKSGQLLHRLGECLVSDFYRPVNVGEIFEGLYPGEGYDPVHSPQRVHQAVCRFRKWLTARRLPVAVTESGRGYRLVARRGRAVTVTVPSARWWKVNRIRGLPLLREHFGGTSFSAPEARRVLRLPQRTVSHLLRRALENGLVQRERGRGHVYAYRFVPA